MSRNKTVTPAYMTGLAVLPYIGWTGGTLVGAICGNILPTTLSNALGIMIYGMFLAIIIPAMRKEHPILVVVCVAVLLSCIIHFVPVFSFITDGFSIIICAVAASAVGRAALSGVRRRGGRTCSIITGFIFLSCLR